ncbi:MAG: UDP-N-acetylglucosamine 1-carboxyvinyltransferase [Candidatus Tokpelaia sp.]|uniref:UDP-N-acetylglucosamine 1-carboxyvinyltransferase n=1 Tax=Candidatus Tokpelaia sp. TaxID=2233777 RepID=UPI00123AE144|nr:UDP-N-acetylglucosamine 1-carboxyvinyltransferase [Candidatus Tokpelaia sp.]KAA6205099.1 MAG: UDP-N-acetylglucosamine 1-carboxyvinyltransferase [Candidatus Tokpelaia sp.]KAA6206018.1 MAG: UDP-N-acetylglucosamine 1-carboxyvinyltransferase [Candidatus Tokpelaia sp.]KAA6406121.1 UDP-N-acetylglucosamine 1-carboxyvinyltransferase [Candidatus Tokpelaia sp.]
MDRIRIVGGHRLNGEISISGAKNAALPLIIASLLTEEPLTLENVPSLADVEQLIRILGNHGVDYALHGRRKAHTSSSYARVMRFEARNIVNIIAPYDLVSRMRAGFWVIGPLLARMGEAEISLPGGCAIGTRPVDFILDGLRALGAVITIENGYVHARAAKGLHGASYHFPKITVGGTHVLLMAASLAKGETVLHNAAQEPEVVNLAECLTAMGAQISGAGTRTIRIKGVEYLSGAQVKVIPDRIEAGTYAFAAAATGGNVLLRGANPNHLPIVLEKLQQAGARVDWEEDGVRIRREAPFITPVDIETAAYPGFPTDLQAQFMGLMTRAQGTAKITETIFENRFMHVQELARLGAHISLAGQTAEVEGVPLLQGAQVMATDLRASVSLVIAGLMAEGETIVNRVYHLDRGFERLEEKLAACGAEIERLRS